MTESVIDFPKDGLCPDVWEKGYDQNGTNEIWKLTEETKSKILNVYQTVCPEAQTVHIIGSITSNQYTEKGDVDVHFLNVNAKFNSDVEVEQYRKSLQEKYKQKIYIGTHPIEVYYQDNEFQDYMSVGCYDVLKQKWIVGPELQNPEFNPYSEYYSEISQKSEKLANQIRNMIFSIYEIAVVLKKNAGTQLYNQLFDILKSRLNEVKKLYNEIRNSRKVHSSPTSKEQALKYRSSREWKVADAAFKLFDKYGYLEIMRKLISLNEILITPEVSEEAATSILDIVKKYINNADKLSEKELYSEDEPLEEGAIQNALLAVLLAIPGILPAASVKKSMDTQPSYSYIVNDINRKCKMYGPYSAFQAANIIARTLFAEARNDGEKGLNAVASVIYNRANGKVVDLANVCKKHVYSKKASRDIYQFSCWNRMTDSEWSPKNFKVKLPKAVKKGSAEQKLWEKAMEITAEMLAGTFKPTTNATMYYNPKTANPKWKNQLADKKMIGSHLFGTLKNHSAFV